MLSLNFSHFISACLNTQMLPCWQAVEQVHQMKWLYTERKNTSALFLLGIWNKCCIRAIKVHLSLDWRLDGRKYGKIYYKRKPWQWGGEDYPHEKNRTTKLCELSYNVLAICCGWWDQIWQRVGGNTFQKRPGLKHCSMADMLNAIKVTSFKTNSH